ncbi:unnamed protein product [Adineta ricciae]|uniref:Peptidase S1 domain-containing protein n=1 Tax=Adineta ricciae TaxID=249248 RepID=A0A813QNP2_ADIRI|nr:unnamed protein product [Adineta ricciae]CAF1563325.1 unnamed protein product [Adineta ricciae]
MNYSSPAYGGSVAASASSSKITMTIIIVLTVVTIVCLGILGIALGVGLGVGLRQSSRAITVLAAPTVSCSPTTATCGCPSTQPTFSARLIGGQTAAANSWPWMVYLTIGTSRICSGFLITQRHVLTASSCVKPNANNITVNYGTSTYQPSVVGVNVTSANFTVDSYDSVAILTLAVNLTYTTNIQPCCLTTDLTEPFIQEHGVITGWGQTVASTNVTVAPNLQQAVVRIQNPTTCAISANDFQFCGSFGSIQTCPADVGAPLMTNFDNVWTCAGIVTGSATNCNSPIIFTRTAAYSSFIKNITGLVF